VPYRDRPWILEAKTMATAFTNILFFVLKRRELRVIRNNVSLIVCGYWYLCNKPSRKIWNVTELKEPLELRWDHCCLSSRVSDITEDIT
jgi:hypothetical protein